MENILGTYPVFYKGSHAGQMNVSQKGLMTSFSAICPINENKMLRLYIISQGNIVPMGVMMPCEKSLTFAKTFSKNALSATGIVSIDKAVLAERREDISLFESGFSAYPPNTWKRECSPWRFFDDEEIVTCCREIKSALSKEDGEKSYLAVPVNTKEPFPMMPIFCFGRYEQINGKDYIIFTMKNGKFV